MNYPLICNSSSFNTISPKVPRVWNFNVKPIFCTSFHSNNPSNNTINRRFKLPLSDQSRPVLSPNIDRIGPGEVSVRGTKRGRGGKDVKRRFGEVGIGQMLVVCGLGYWVQGFRCFPWLALNFNMAHNLNLHPLTLQLVQNTGNLPMVAKPLYGILSDALYIGGAHRIPYICIGVLLQILSWGPLALFPVAGKALPSLMACVLLGNLGASIVEVAKDALVVEYGQKHRVVGIQSYAFMAAAVGGILGNLLGGYILPKVPPTTMFLIFGVLLSVQIIISLSVKEGSLGLAQPSSYSLPRKSISKSFMKQISNLVMAISEESISRPLMWLVASVAMVPILSGSIFCYQAQCLHLDPSVIGMSRVIGQLTLLTLTLLYDCYWKKLPLRKLIGIVQILYASSLLLDFILVRQINLRLGIPNELFALCFSGLAETLAQFKLLPFSMLLASLCPPGCIGSLMSFSASTMCLSSIASGFLGIGLASVIGITSQDYSSLPMGILIQFLAALIPLLWIHHVPLSQPFFDKVGKKGMSKRTRKNRRVGKAVLDSVFVYRRERESESQF